MRACVCRNGKILLWHVESGLERGTIKEVRPDDEPNPSIVVEEMLPDGAMIQVVWSWLATTERAKLVCPSGQHPS
jgi:hypothetical protein